MKIQGSQLAEEIDNEYKRAKYMKKKAKLKRLSNNKTGIVRVEQNRKKQVEVDG